MTMIISFAITVFAILIVVLLIMMVHYSLFKEDYDKAVIIFECLIANLAIFIFLIIWGDDLVKEIKYEKEIECKEYKVETIITTKSDISDTTYVIKYK